MPFKKHKSTHFSLVSSTLGPLVIPYVKDEDVHSWKNRSPSKENEAIIKASSEILVAALNLQSSLNASKARLKALKGEKEKMSKQLKDTSSNIEKLKAELDHKDRYYKQKLTNQAEVLAGLNTTYDELEKEKDALVSQLDGLLEDQKNEWADVRQREKDASFEEGFKNYASDFLAVDPEYDFTKFREDMVKWISDFKVQHAAYIKEKRVAIGLEQATVDKEDASLPNSPIPVNMSPIQVDDDTANPPPSQEDAPNDPSKETPTDSSKDAP